MIKRAALFCLLSVTLITAMSHPAKGLESSPGIFGDHESLYENRNNNTIWNAERDRDPGLREFLKDTAIMYSFVWGARFYYVRNKDDRIFDTSFSKFFSNITDVDVDDGDGFFTNYVVHGYFGYFYYLYYREMGHSLWVSALGSATMSTLWEYTIEGPIEPPSLTDLIATPGIGIPAGIAMENLSTWLLQKDNVVATVAAHIINPMKLFIKDQQRGLINPLTGQWAFMTRFTLPENKEKAIRLSYPYFNESPLPLGMVSANLEFVNLKSDVGKQLILYAIRVDFPSRSQRWGVYLRAPFAGVNDVFLDGEEISDGWELANSTLGVKGVLRESEDYVFSAGFDLIMPTSFKDTPNRLQAASQFTRDFPYMIQRMWTASPYVTGALLSERFTLIGSFATDFITNAKRFEGDSFEFRLRYGAAGSFEVPTIFSPVAFVEFNGYTLTTADTVRKTDLFVTPGIRFGTQFSPGIRMQFPLTGTSADVANYSTMIDFQARF